MKNSTYDPQKVSCFEKEKLNFCGQSVESSAMAGDLKNIDLLLTDDFLITGGILMVKNAKFGDFISLQILHPVYGVVNTFVVKYMMIEDSQKQFQISLPYPAKLRAGLSIRLVYSATSDISIRNIALNYELHKVLI